MGCLPAHSMGVALLEMFGEVTAVVLSCGRTEDTGVVLLEEVAGGRTALRWKVGCHQLQCGRIQCVRPDMPCHGVRGIGPFLQLSCGLVMRCCLGEAWGMLWWLLLHLATCMTDFLGWHKVDDLQLIVNDPEVACEFHRWGVHGLGLYEGKTP